MPLSDQHRRRRGRNFALAASLVALIIIIFMVSLVKLQELAQ